MSGAWILVGGPARVEAAFVPGAEFGQLNELDERETMSMALEIGDEESELLLLIRSGISEIRVYEAGLYPTVVSFAVTDGELVTI